MLKMILDPMGGILCVNFFFEEKRAYTSDCRLTNDGNAILREIDVAHPAAKNMIELSRTQDEECGDGTTSVIILGIYLLFHATNHTLMFFF
jgi:T-complex protein 1 subunit gamma